MIGRAVLASLFVSVALPSSAQLPMEPVPAGTSSAPPYVGPGDLSLGTVYAYYGMRAYSAAVATALTNAIQLRRASDGSTMNIPLTAAGNLNTGTAATFCAATSCFVQTLYDQTGNGHNLTAASNLIAYTSSCINSKPCANNPNASAFLLAGLSTHAQPYTFIAVGERTGRFTSAQTITATDDGSHPSRINWAASANTFHMEGASTISATATDSVWHVFLGMFNGASPNSVLAIDGVETTGGVGTGLSGASIQVMYDNGNSNLMSGNWTESIIYLSTISSANRTAYCQNAQAYWSAGNFGATC